MKRSFKKIIIVITALVIALSLQLPALASHEPQTKEVKSLESLGISFQPEYDSQSVLVIFRGALPHSVKLPAKVKLYIPKGARVSSTAAVDSQGQFQYDQAWNSHTVTPGDDYDLLEYETMFPNFQAEIYYSPVGQEAQRNFDFKIKTPFEVKSLLFEIQKPLEATDFKVEPASANVDTRENFEYHNYSFTEMPADKEFNYKVAYNKANSKPSVSTQPGQVNTTGGGATASGGSQGNTVLVMVLILGVLATGVILGVWRSRASSAPVLVGKQYNSSKYNKKQKPKAKNAKYCGSCGAKLEEGAKFCAGCGAKTK